MRRHVLHLGAVVILALCIWGHVSELFDHWDNTFQSGKDLEYSTVIVVLIVGAAIVFDHVAAVLSGTRSRMFYQDASVASPSFAAPTPAVFIAGSPPLPLRI